MEQKKYLLRAAQAGFEEKNDILVRVSPGTAGSGLQARLSSPVQKQYGRHMEQLLLDTARLAGFEDVMIEAADQGAWDYTIQARLLAALERGAIA